MNETTQIAYGDGTISFVMNSASATEVAAPDVRLGDYQKAMFACFTEKELQDVAVGTNAELVMNFTMMDELDNPKEIQQFEEAIEGYEKELGRLNQGVYIKMEASKSLDGYEFTDFDTFYEDIEIQLDTPLYLMAEGRTYYLMTNFMGACELLPDIDEQSDLLTINAHSMGDSLILYQNEKDMLVEKENKILIKAEYLFVGGIILLALGWWAIDRLYRRDRG